jgi:O-antigen ligase
LLLPSASVSAACPIISSSRGGALVAAGMALLAAFLVLAWHFLPAAHHQADRRWRSRTLSSFLLFFAAAVALGFALGWKALQPRLGRLQEGYEGREQLYTVARRMAADYPIFGTGPGTYENVSELYRPSTGEFLPAQAHNDWLETRVTFGWSGSLLIYLALGAAWLQGFARGGIHAGRRFLVLIWVALAGCLVHARFDFPFQLHSILFLFLMLCAMITGLSWRASPRGA